MNELILHQVAVHLLGRFEDGLREVQGVRFHLLDPVEEEPVACRLYEIEDVVQRLHIFLIKILDSFISLFHFDRILTILSSIKLIL